MLLAVAIAIVYAGWWLGSAYGERRAAAAIAEADSEWNRILASRPDGITVGRSFPSFPLWTASSNQVLNDLREALPRGGMAISLAGACSSCLNIAEAFCDARPLVGGGLCDVVLIVSGGDAQSISDSLTAREVNLPVFVDEQLSLFREFGVVANPTFFALDTIGVVKYIGVGMRNSEELAVLIGEYCASGAQGNPLEGGE